MQGCVNNTPLARTFLISLRYTNRRHESIHHHCSIVEDTILFRSNFVSLHTPVSCHTVHRHNIMPHDHSSALTIAIGGISHESHSFSDVPTEMVDFEQQAMLSGARLLEHAKGTDSVLGGIVDAAEKDRVKVIPTLFAAAPPSGPVDHATWEQLCHWLQTRIRTAAIRDPGIDGVILTLHGAMTTTEELDADGVLAETVRDIVGDGTPVVVVLDFHANPSDRLVQQASAVLSYRTYPHIDVHATGAAALAACKAIIHGDVMPRTAIRRLPILLPLTAQRTNGPTPMASLVRQASSLTRLPGVLQASLLPGFPFGDVPHAGMTVMVTTDNDRDHAESLASRFSERAWQFGRSLASSAIPLSSVTAPLRHSFGKPVIFADIADNPDAGAPGDHTGLVLHALEHHWTHGLIATIVDPEVVAMALEVGAGGILDAHVGGKCSRFSGESVYATWEVLSCGSAVPRNIRPMRIGDVTRFGRTAVLRHHGVMVIVAERRQQVIDPGIVASHGIDVSTLGWIVIKSGVHFRAAFEPIASEIIEVDAGGLTSEASGRFAYHHVNRPILPLDSLDTVNRGRAKAAGTHTHVR